MLCPRSKRHRQTKLVLILWFLYYYSWKISVIRAIHIFSVWLRTSSDPLYINRFQSHCLPYCHIKCLSYYFIFLHSRIYGCMRPCLYAYFAMIWSAGLLSIVHCLKYVYVTLHSNSATRKMLRQFIFLA